MTPGEATEALDPDPFRAELLGLYAELDAAVAAQAPVCQLSGRCCRFAEYGHTLFVSAPEVALLLADAPAPVRALDNGETCPWQDARGHCTARQARPLGCRVYYCEAAFQPHVGALGEAFVAKLKKLADAYAIPWNYAPLHHHLHEAQTAGRFPPISPAAALDERPVSTFLA